MFYSLFITALVYPISGFWKWGGGWLDALGFYDFAGSVVVHGVGGFAALAAAIVIGPRIGRFKYDEAAHLSGHSLALATSGVFILWIGWYGFNPGSQLAFSGEANIAATMLIAVNTTLAAAAGGVAAMITSSLHEHSHKVSLSMLLNGVLAGLVAITASCDSVTNNEAIIIGLIGGVLVVFGGGFLKKSGSTMPSVPGLYMACVASGVVSPPVSSAAMPWVSRCWVRLQFQHGRLLPCSCFSCY